MSKLYFIAFFPFCSTHAEDETCEVEPNLLNGVGVNVCIPVQGGGFNASFGVIASETEYTVYYFLEDTECLKPTGNETISYSCSQTPTNMFTGVGVDDVSYYYYNIDGLPDKPDPFVKTEFMPMFVEEMTGFVNYEFHGDSSCSADPILVKGKAAGKCLKDPDVESGSFIYKFTDGKQAAVLCLLLLYKDYIC
jgi:hypothetical protein